MPIVYRLVKRRVTDNRRGMVGLRKVEPVTVSHIYQPAARRGSVTIPVKISVSG